MNTKWIISVFLFFELGLICGFALPVNANSLCEDSHVGCASLNEEMLHSLVIVYRDFQVLLNKDSINASKRSQKLSPTMTKLLDPNNYAVDIKDEEETIVVKFDPKKIRLANPISGGSVIYTISKKDFAFQRRLIK